MYRTAPRKSSYDKYDIDKLLILVKEHTKDNELVISGAVKAVEKVEARSLLPQRLSLKADFPIDAVIVLTKSQASIMYHNYLVQHGDDKPMDLDDLSEDDIHKLIKNAILSLREIRKHTPTTEANPNDDEHSITAIISKTQENVETPSDNN